MSDTYGMGLNPKRGEAISHLYVARKIAWEKVGIDPEFLTIYDELNEAIKLLEADGE